MVLIVPVFSNAIATNSTVQNEVTDAKGSKWSDEGWGDEGWEEEKSPWQIHGIIDSGFGIHTDGKSYFSENSLEEIRHQSQIEYQGERLKFNWVFDAYYDGVYQDTLFENRELSLLWSAEQFDVKAGRQVLTWGTGDLLFLNDLFAKDWSSFFSGRDDDYLKKPSDAVKMSWFSNWVNIDLVWSPDFGASNLIDGTRFVSYNPIVDSYPTQPEYYQSQKTSGSEYDMRLFSNVNGIEYALYSHIGYAKEPNTFGVVEDTSGQVSYAELSTIGLSVRGTLGAWLLSGEYANYQFDNESGWSKPVDQQRLLVAAETSIAAKLTMVLQLYSEQYEAASSRNVLTLRLTNQALMDKLTSRLYWAYSLNQNDSFIKADINYKFTDAMQVTAGLHVMESDNPMTFFGQLEPNDNLFVRFTYYY